jgi:uncharacterized delta-60 repeat protein
MLKRSIAVALGVLALSAGVALGSPAGDLDPSFDGDGKLVLPDPYVANEVLVQQDGKIVVVGNGGPADDFVVTRLNPEGSRDGSYDGDGTAVVDFGNQEHANAAALQPDGKLIVAGESQSGTGDAVAVARLNPNGTLDATFDPGGPEGDGKKLLTGGQGASLINATAVLVQPDGRIVLAAKGYSDDYDMAVTRLTPTGAVDGTVWDRGRFDAQAIPHAGALAPDGKIVVAGTKHPDGSPSEIALARFDSDGKLDKTFGGTGKVTFASAGDELVEAVLVQPDGRIVVAGAAGASGYEMVVTRFNRDGTPDTSWDGDARAFADFDGPSIGAAAALQPDGKIVVAGTSLNEVDIAAARFNPTGTPDASFGSAGTSTIAGGFIEIGQAVALQRDGRVIVAGQSAGGAPVVRLLADPPPASGANVHGDDGNGGGGGGGGAVADRIAPVVGSLSLANRTFRVGSRPRGASRRVRSGTAFRFRLSEAATVRFAIERKTTGRRARGRCRPATRRNRGARRCTRYMRVGTLARGLEAGRPSVSFSGRLRGRALRRASYRVVVQARDAAGNRSATRTAAFRVVR